MCQRFAANFDAPAYKGTFIDAVEAMGNIFSSIAAGTKADIDIAAKAAKKACKTSWGLKVPQAQHGRLISKLAGLMQEHIVEFTIAASGMAYNTMYGRDNKGAIATNENKLAYTRHEPIGIVIAPALATCSTIVLKPSEFTSLSALLFCVINIHPLIEKVVFTGSTLTGRKLRRLLRRACLTFEFGGKSPDIIFDDAWATHGIYFNHGQNCVAGSRIFVQESIYDEFLNQSIEQVCAINVGDPSSDGSQVSKTKFEPIMGYITSNKNNGATIHLGGKQIGQGYFIEPIVFTECQLNISFGLVACIMKFKTECEVVEQANDTSYGLAASVFTKDIDRAIHVAHALEAGTTWTEISMSFGGFKQSGIGRELSEYALENYTNVKAFRVNIGIRL
ncbi:ALDH-like protein [Suillus decipiens]|nr:ALDH-like protein [Suillus decipiens]